MPSGKSLTWEILQFWTVKQLHCSIECITVNMDNVLAQIPGQFKLLDQVVSLSKLAREIRLLESLFLGKDVVDLDGEELVSLLLAIEEFGPFGGIVDDF